MRQTPQGLPPGKDYPVADVLPFDSQSLRPPISTPIGICYRDNLPERAAYCRGRIFCAANTRAGCPPPGLQKFTAWHCMTD